MSTSLPPDPASPGNSLPRDSLFAERIRWTGAPKEIVIAPLHRVLAWSLGTMSLISTLLAIAAAETGQGSTGKLLFFAAWTATFAIIVRMVPVLWAQAARYTITDRYVIWQSGKMKRMVQRAGVSFARITWSRRNPEIGDIDLVRAVPTGALHRRLTLTLQGVAAPHRVWAIVRGAKTLVGQEGGGEIPLEQRLDASESMRWTAYPQHSWRAWLPMSTRRTLTAAIGALCLMVAVRNLILGLPLVERLSQAGLKDTTFAFIALVGALGLTVVLLLMLGGWFLHMGISRKALLDRATRYVITNQRVILQRGRQELHIDRAIIVDIADRDGLYGGRDAYLILDGPQARALSAQGAFGPGERARGFRPLLQGLTEDEVQTLRTELFRTRIDPRQEAEDHVPSTTAVGTDQEQNT